MIFIIFYINKKDKFWYPKIQLHRNVYWMSFSCKLMFKPIDPQIYSLEKNLKICFEEFTAYFRA